MLLRKAVVACGLCMCVSNLGAEKSGAYVEGGFQYSNFSGIRSVDNTPLPTPKRVTTNGFTNTYGEHGRNVMGALYNGNLYGVDLQFGYKQFFGKKRHFGLRYYGMFSGQGGEFSGMGSALGTSYVNQPSANLFYGVGMDALFNLYERGDRTFGFFAGVMIGGSSWLMGRPSGNASCRWEKDPVEGTGCGTMNQYMGNLAKVKDPDLALKHSPNYVQFVVNMGFRTNLTKHQGFEFGVRVPTINDPYFTATFTKADSSSCGYDTSPYCGGKGSKITHTFRRNVSIYWNYVYNF